VARRYLNIVNNSLLSFSGAAAHTLCRRPLEVTAMQCRVAGAAQRDQVLLRIIPGLTAKFLVMNLEVLQAPAGLTSPSIPLQDFSTKLLVQFGSQSQAWLLRSNLTHDTF